MKCKLSELMEIIGGGTPKTSIANYWNGNIPWLTVKDFNNDYRYVYNTEKYISEAGLLNSSTVLLKKNDIIISARGTVGEIAMIPYPMAFNQSCYGLRANESVVDSVFLYYLIKSKISLLKQKTHGSVFDTITRDTFNGIEVDLLPISIQKKIAKILSALDDKIELNNKINKNLEEQALLIYKLMFDKCEINGKLSDIIIENPKSKIKVGDAKGVVGEYPFFTSGQAILEYNHSLINGRNCYLNTGGNAAVEYYNGKAAYSTDTWCICGKNDTTEYLYLLFKSMGNELNDVYFEGSALKHLKKVSLKEKNIYIPNVKEIEKFNSIIVPILDLISKNYINNKCLMRLRNSLLPKLMSGEIDVDNIEV